MLAFGKVLFFFFFFLSPRDQQKGGVHPGVEILPLYEAR